MSTSYTCVICRCETYLDDCTVNSIASGRTICIGCWRRTLAEPDRPPALRQGVTRDVQDAANKDTT